MLALCECKLSGRPMCLPAPPMLIMGKQPALKTSWPRPQCQEGLTGCELRLQLLTAEGRRCPWQTGSEKLPIFWQLVAAECEMGIWAHSSAGGGRDLGPDCLSQRTQRHCGLTVPCHTRSSIAGYHSGLGGGRHVDLILTVLQLSIRSERNPEQALGPRANLCKICRGRKYA